MHQAHVPRYSLALRSPKRDNKKGNAARPYRLGGSPDPSDKHGPERHSHTGVRPVLVRVVRIPGCPGWRFPRQAPKSETLITSSASLSPNRYSSIGKRSCHTQKARTLRTARVLMKPENARPSALTESQNRFAHRRDPSLLSAPQHEKPIIPTSTMSPTASLARRDTAQPAFQDR